MQTEIEIKFLVTRNIAEDLASFLALFEIKESSQQQLSNIYFDTPALDLRYLDMGLRIRRCDGFAEQTIKCRGKVVGGLHIRPEYNAPICGDLPVLAAFPDQIWPDIKQRDHIQQQLVAQFCTDFLRRQWLIAFAGSEIELAWDQGKIVGTQGQTNIHELELEIKTGDPAALFALAQRLVHLGGLRLGAQSKAQRGYRLAGLGKPLGLQPLMENKKMDIATAIAAGLVCWQHHEQLWLENPQDEAVRQQAFGALRQGVELIADNAALLPQTVAWGAKLVSLREHLTANLSQHSEWPTELAELFLCPAYVELQLTITAWLHRTQNQNG